MLKFLILGWQKASPRLWSEGFLFFPTSLTFSVFFHLDSRWLLCPVDHREIFTNCMTVFYQYSPFEAILAMASLRLEKESLQSPFLSLHPVLQLPQPVSGYQALALTELTLQVVPQTKD